MKTRLGIASALVALVIVVGAGCTGDPAPATSTTGFTSEEQAFAAAEKTYRAYVDALNQVDLSDPATFEPVYEWTTGDANASERKALTTMHADGWTVTGASEIVKFAGTTFKARAAISVIAIACTDVSKIQVLDGSGISQVAKDRPSRYALRIDFESSGVAPNGLLISTSNAIEDPSCASP